MTQKDKRSKMVRLFGRLSSFASVILTTGEKDLNEFRGKGIADSRYNTRNI